MIIAWRLLTKEVLREMAVEYATSGAGMYKGSLDRDLFAISDLIRKGELVVSYSAESEETQLMPIDQAPPGARLAAMQSKQDLIAKGYFTR